MDGHHFGFVYQIVHKFVSDRSWFAVGDHSVCSHLLLSFHCLDLIPEVALIVHSFPFGIALSLVIFAYIICDFATQCWNFLSRPGIHFAPFHLIFEVVSPYCSLSVYQARILPWWNYFFESLARLERGILVILFAGWVTSLIHNYVWHFVRQPQFSFYSLWPINFSSCWRYPNFSCLLNLPTWLFWILRWAYLYLMFWRGHLYCFQEAYRNCYQGKYDWRFISQSEFQF